MGKVLAVVPGRDVGQERRLEVGQHVDSRGVPAVVMHEAVRDTLLATT